MTPPSRQGCASSPLGASELLWPALLTLCAVGLGSYRLTDKNLWVDEAASAAFALGGPSDWLADHNMALYYMLLSAWVRVFGLSELALRTPSVVCFALSVPLMYGVARSSFGVPSARIASALHIANAFMLQFAQEARGYMLLVVLVLCAQLALNKLLERPRFGWSALYGVSLGLASYAHMFAIWTLLAHAVVLAPRWLHPTPERRAGITAFAIAALISAPLFVQLIGATTAQVSWIRPLSPRSFFALPVIWTGGGVFLAIATCACFAVFARGVRAKDPQLRLFTQLCVAWFVVPLAATLLVSVAVAPLLQPKYLIGAVPALQLGAASALSRWPRRWSYASCALLWLLSALRIHDWYTQQQKERWLEAVDTLAARMKPGEPLILDLPCPEPFDFYVKQQRFDQRWAAPRWPVRPWTFPTPDEQPVARETVLGELAREAPARIWQISNRSANAPPLGPLATRYRIVSDEHLMASGDTADALFGSEGALVITIRLWSLPD